MASSMFLLFVLFVISLSCIASSFHMAQMDNKFRPRISPYGGRGVGLRGSGGLRGGGSGIRSGVGLRGSGGLGGSATLGGGGRLGGSVGLVGGGGIGLGFGGVGLSGGGGLRAGVGLGEHDVFAHDSASEAKLGGDTDGGNFEGGGEANNIKTSGGRGGKV